MAGVSLAACGGQAVTFDREAWAAQSGNATGENPRLAMVSAAREAGLERGASRDDVRDLLGEPDGAGADTDTWFLGRDDMAADFRILRVAYDFDGRVTRIAQETR